MNQPYPSYLKKDKGYFHDPVFIGLIALNVLLLLAIIIVSCLYLENRRQRDLTLTGFQETQRKLDQIRISLAQGDTKKALTVVAETQSRVSELLPPVAETAPETIPAEKPARPPAVETASKPASPEQPPQAPAAPARTPETIPAATPAAKPPAAATPEKQPPPITPAGFAMAADETAYPFILANANEYLLACEKDSRTLHLFRFVDTRVTLVKSYPCIVGANGLDKKKAGDLATPVGNYFTMRYIPGKSLPAKYGHGAFVLNYPNFLDRRDKKDGTGIWLHGHLPEKNLGDPELQNTKGCIAVGNDVLKELTGLIPAGGTPMVIVNRLRTAKIPDQRKISDELTAFMASWAKAWETGKTEPFMDHYAPDFVNSDGMNYQAYKRQKERVNVGKKFIDVKVEHPAILLLQEKNGEIAVIRFVQRYRSSNFKSDTRKLFYLKKGQGGWRIFGESRM